MEKGQIIASIDEVPVKATLTGVLRGLLRDGYPVTEGFKIADIDPRESEQKIVSRSPTRQGALREACWKVS